MKNKIIFKVLFYIYIVYLLIEIINFGRIANVGSYEYLGKVWHCCNFVPLRNLGTLYSLFKSFIMYMPLGVLGRYSFKYLENSKHFIIFIFLFITFHDLVQVVTLKGYFDINHIMIGTIGSVLAYYLIEVMRKYIPRQTEVKH